MTDLEKAEEIYKDNKFELEVKGGVQDEQEILFMLEKMAAWKQEQMIEKMENFVRRLYLPAYPYLDRENLELIQDIKEAMMEE